MSTVKKPKGMPQLQPLFKSTLAAALVAFATPVMAQNELRVCADPNNLPFSNQRLEGFENKIAALLADDLRMKPSYFWQKQRQGFVRQTLGANRCDAIMGIPASYDRVLSTQPYYRSGYAFVSVNSRHLSIKSFDDPQLRELKIGLHAIGSDGANSPPAHALARRGLAKNVVGYSMWGDASVENPQGELIKAVADGEIDLAIVWGPIGGYFAKKYGSTLVVTLAPADKEMPSQPFTFDIAIGVRKDNKALAAKLEKSLERKQREIRNILDAYNIPFIQSSTGATASQQKLNEATPDYHKTR